MCFKEIEHTDDIVKDIRNIFSEENSSLVFISKEVYSKLKKSKGIWRSKQDVDFCHHYKKGGVVCFQKTLNHQSPLCDTVTDAIGIIAETSDLYMVTYFKSYYVDMDFGEEHSNEFISTIAKEIKRIVNVK